MPASAEELLARRSARLALFAAKLLASSLAAFITYQRLAALSPAPLGLREVLVSVGPILTVALFDISGARGTSNPAADMVTAIRASIVAAVTMMIIVPLVLGGSGLVAGMLFAAVMAPSRVVLSGLTRTAAHRLSAPVRIVVFCDNESDRQLQADLAAQQLPSSAEVFSWRAVFPTDMSVFCESWLASAGRIWDPTDLLIVVGADVIRSAEHLRVMSRLEDLGARVISLDRFYERYLGRTRVTAGESLLLLLQLHEGRSAYGWVKSVIETLVAIVGLAVLALVGPAIAILVKVTSKGPVLYRQERIGLHGRPFTLLKFRTMKVDAEQDGPRFARSGDDRITTVGRFLRRTRLDEFPQVWNVLRREMSVVGPRPERPEFTAQLTAMFPAYNKRLLVRPGITGWAQVNEEYAFELEDHRRKLERDLYYVRHRSPTLDLQCVARTLASMVRMGGR